MAKKSKNTTAQEDTNCLFLQQNGIRYLLTKNESHYLLVKISADRIHKLSSVLMSKGATSPDTWKKNGFPVKSIPYHALRCILAKGHEAITEIELQMGQEWMVFTLSQVYEESVLKEFFPAHLVSRQFINREDVDRVRKIRQWTTGILYALGFFACGGLLFLGSPYWLWCSLCIGVQLACVILPVWKPLLFCLCDYPKGSPPPPGNLIWAPNGLGFILGLKLCSLPFVTSNFILTSAGVTAIVALPLSFLLIKRSVFSRMRPFFQFFLTWLSVLFLGVGAIGHILYLFA